MNVENCCVREKTIKEEIMELDIDGTVKERIIGKVNKLEKENSNQQTYLINCHCEIDILKGAIIEQAKIISRLSDDVRSMSSS